MPKLKKVRTTGYTKVANVCFFDKRLSFKDVGMYCAMLSLPDDWEWSLKGLVKLHTDKIDSIRTSVNHLLELGYTSRRQTKDANGRFRDIEYIIYDDPQDNPEFLRLYAEKEEKTEDISPVLENPITVPELDLPISDFPTSVNPISEKPASENPRNKGSCRSD